MAKWDKIKSRGSVDDRRATPGVGTISVTGVLLLMGVTYLLGGNPLEVLTQVDPAALQGVQQPADTAEFEGEDSYEVFVSTVLGSTNDYWQAELAKQNKTYNEPPLVLFRGGTQSACGGALSAVGPHYCPADDTIYIDETFFDELQRRYGAQGGDVAEAYVIAHEVGHHVQNELGILHTHSHRDNEKLIKLELMADCFAGLWAHSLRDSGVFEPGEIREAMDAAAAVGDDSIQKRTQGTIQPETWTHGSSEDRVRAFTTGYQTGIFQRCL